MLEEKPKVSVIVQTYNHSKYIAQALDSVLSQKTNFPIEIITSEDCSTDDTRVKLLSYQARHPHRIKLLLSSNNLNTNIVGARAFEAAAGRYIALLDGDDFWTCSSKLQEQADFLDIHSKYAMCYHNAALVNESSVAVGAHYVEGDVPSSKRFSHITRHNFIPSCSAFFRRDTILPLPSWYSTAIFGDWPLYLLAAQHGYIYYSPRVHSAYRVHSQGLWSGQTKEKKLLTSLEFLESMRELFETDVNNRAQSDRAFEAGIMHACYCVAVHYEAMGDRAAARRYLARALRQRSFGENWMDGLGLRSFGRLCAPQLFSAIKWVIRRKWANPTDKSSSGNNG